MKRTKQHLAMCVAAAALLLGVACDYGPTQTSLAYPEAPRGVQVDMYFGENVADPYRWLEEVDTEETAAWVAAQNDLAVPFLTTIPQREEIKQRLTELWNFERFGIPEEEGGKYLFTRNDGLQDQSVVYVTESLAEEARVLLDPNAFSEDGTIALSSWIPSPNGRFIAYSTSDGGTDWKSWKVRLIDTGEDQADFITRCKFTDVSWSRDSGGFYYSAYPANDDGSGDGSKPVSLFFHRLGTEQDQDQLIYETPEGKGFNAYGSVTEDGRYLIVNYFEGYNSNAISVLRLDRPGRKLVDLLPEWDALYTFLGSSGPELYFQTTKDAPMGRIVAINADRRGPSSWREIVPEAEEALRGASYVDESIVASYLKDAHSLVRVFGTNGSLTRTVELPGIGTTYGFDGHGNSSETFYAYSDYITPEAIYRYDVETGESTLFRRADTGFDTDQYETRQVFFSSKDGTQVPMFITHKKGITQDGSNPTLLYGYGGFNSSQTPSYRTARVVWLEMGGILAIANLRGGGEYGEEWHLAGTKLNKQNVFDDFIAAAEYLIGEGYTSTPRLAVQGGSNGGLLVGAVITQRPELFGAALPAVGVLDMLRYHLPSANARQWSSDLGLSENKDEYHALRAYSPYHNITDETCYPPTLVTTADHDDRVVPWHSFKFGAALQYAQGCSNPILVRVETRAGHGSGKPTWMRIEDVADQWAFLAKILEM
ncbi:MAG: S9 family peptidase [bacterium]|nr:S9 family peptidase [bacterium]